MTKRGLKPYSSFHTHPVFRDCAAAIAEAIWEDSCSRNNAFNKKFGSELGKARFIQMSIPKLIKGGKVEATLVQMLSGSLPDELKEQVADALIKHKELAAGVWAGGRKRSLTHTVN